ncbi:MAG: roadblock/LC7 domain-containing protein [Anaerolineae bacterium]|nr:roadblock/LC7 domain-containing protein [Anaerolineae bacterium]
MIGLYLPTDLIERAESLLAELHRKTDADCVLLADTSGQLIAVHGQPVQGDTVVIAALGAGNLAAVLELGRQIGERNPHGAFLHEGKDRCIYLFDVSGSFVLIVVFQPSTPIGLVRLYAGVTCGYLGELITEFEELMSTVSQIPSVEFGDALSDELEKVFG